MALNYNPDVLLCLANLSNDEVFTPPNVVNAMLDLLPNDLWSDPKITFLDPCCKSGVFLREIAKRLIKGLEPVIPDLQQRLDHIFHQQLFGIAITELTAFLSRRSVYCSKYANSKWSVSVFDTPEGNIAFPQVQHTWDGNRCRYCGASKEVFGERKETHAYALIHNINPEKLFNMKFDVIIGNPPYQLSDGGAQASASPIYHYFVDAAKRLKPRYISFIIPSRWFSGGKGLDEFRATMLNDKKIVALHDFLDSSTCFPGVEIKGGVCYFLRNQLSNENVCRIVTHTTNDVIESVRPLKENGLDVFIRHKTGVDILQKVLKFKESSFMDLVSSQKPFGLRTFVKGEENYFKDSITLYQNGGIGYIHLDEVERNKEWVPKYKIFISRAYNAGDTYPHQILGRPILGAPNSCCTETYISIGPFDLEASAKNVQTYIMTKFFRFMVYLVKVSQMAPAKVYELVPLQDFSKPWTDEELYQKYGLTEEEIAFIESMIRPMEVNLNV